MGRDGHDERGASCEWRWKIICSTVNKKLEGSLETEQVKTQGDGGYTTRGAVQFEGPPQALGICIMTSACVPRVK